MRFLFAFGFGSITLMFLGFGSGYALAKYILHLDEVMSCICSLVVGIGTLILETILFILKMNRLEDEDRKYAQKQKMASST